LTQIAESIVNPDAQRTTRFDRDVTSQRFGEVERNRPDMR
jgi:hypothetical protein